jgi:hypothetical protein
MMIWCPRVFFLKNYRSSLKYQGRSLSLPITLFLDMANMALISMEERL